MARITAQLAGGQNVVAFLDMIAASEIGPTYEARSDSGYDICVGGSCFNGYADHPRKMVRINSTLSSSAAGRYQFIQGTWDALKKSLNLPDFSPVSQDRAAIELIRQCGALEDVKAGKIQIAIGKCRRIWASFPGAGYGQPERSMASLIAAYTGAGGVLYPSFANVLSGVESTA